MPEDLLPCHRSIRHRTIATVPKVLFVLAECGGVFVYSAMPNRHTALRPWGFPRRRIPHAFLDTPTAEWDTYIPVAANLGPSTKGVGVGPMAV